MKHTNDILIKLFVAALFISISGCAGHRVSSSVQANLNIEFGYPDPNRVRFSGKGAGAGMMLMSSMGAMGVALGVAIDEGIAKEIEETALSNNVNYLAMLKASLTDWLAAMPEAKQANKIKVKIARYGFISKPGSDDPTAIDLNLFYSFADDNWIEINTATQSEIQLPTRPLEQLKKDPQVINRLLVDSFQTLFHNP